MSLSVATPTVQQTQAAMEQHRQSVEPWAKAPRFLIRDASMSALQRLLLIDLLDRRGRGKAYAVVKRATLAADLGVTLSTLDRAIAGLVESGRIEARRSGRAVHYYPAESSILLGLSRQKCYSRVVKSDDSNKQEFLEIEIKQASSADGREKQPGEGQRKAAAAPSPNGPDAKSKERKAAAAAAPEGAGEQAKAVASASAEPGRTRGTRAPSGDLGDPLQTVGASIGLLDVLMRFPASQRPSETPQIVKAVTGALERGWAPAALHRAVAEQITNPKAGPGLVVRLLIEVCQRAPSFSETREAEAESAEKAKQRKAKEKAARAERRRRDAEEAAASQRARLEYQAEQARREEAERPAKYARAALVEVAAKVYRRTKAPTFDEQQRFAARALAMGTPSTPEEARIIAASIAPQHAKVNAAVWIKKAIAAAGKKPTPDQAKWIALDLWIAAHDLINSLSEEQATGCSAQRWVTSTTDPTLIELKNIHQVGLVPLWARAQKAAGELTGDNVTISRPELAREILRRLILDGSVAMRWDDPLMAHSIDKAERVGKQAIVDLGSDGLRAADAQRSKPDAEVLAILEGRKPEAELTGAAACRAALQGANA